MQRLGFFGGCFNPPTIAHYELATKALEIANLDKVYFVPMGDYYKKEGLVLAEDRFQMLKKMTRLNPKLDVSRIQMEQLKDLKAIDTFKLINNRFQTSQNFFIMGSDNYKKISTWKDSKELLLDYNYIVLNRGDFSGNNVVVVDTTDDLKNISSSLVRDKILKKQNIEKLVTKEVEKYILQKKLYGQSA
ncbi:MAG: nicotinate (nicotinamide) nucleotide adenylyltransferase [Clostridia bacterium]|nr:nicotinate (nicotinamide) nucleotide adenylyltransferase [Clostridia bacterium]